MSAQREDGTEREADCVKLHEVCIVQECCLSVPTSQMRLVEAPMTCMCVVATVLSGEKEFDAICLQSTLR